MGQAIAIGAEAALRSAVGEAFLDLSEADWTVPQPFVTITPQAGHPLRDVVVILDLDKATTGAATILTTQEIAFRVSRKVDGTNWRAEQTTTPAAGSTLDGLSQRLDIGPVGVDEEVRVEVFLDTEASAADLEAPFVVYWRGEPPTIVAATETV
jgi:hypothetical protein